MRSARRHHDCAASQLAPTHTPLSRAPSPSVRSSKATEQAERIKRDNELLEDLESQIAELEEDRSEQALDKLVQKSKSASKESASSTNARPLA